MLRRHHIDVVDNEDVNKESTKGVNPYQIFVRNHTHTKHPSLNRLVNATIKCTLTYKSTFYISIRKNTERKIKTCKFDKLAKIQFKIGIEFLFERR